MRLFLLSFLFLAGCGSQSSSTKSDSTGPVKTDTYKLVGASFTTNSVVTTYVLTSNTHTFTLNQLDTSSTTSYSSSAIGTATATYPAGVTTVGCATGAITSTFLLTGDTDPNSSLGTVNFNTMKTTNPCGSPSTYSYNPISEFWLYGSNGTTFQRRVRATVNGAIVVYDLYYSK